MAYKTTEEILDFYRSQSGVKGNSASDMLDFYNNQQQEREAAIAAREQRNRESLFNPAEAQKVAPPAGYTESYLDKSQQDHPEKMFGSSFDNGSYEARIKTMSDWLTNSGQKYMTPESLSSLQAQVKRGEVKDWGIVKPKRSIAAAVGDTALNFVGGVASGIKVGSDLFGAGNAVSEYFDRSAIISRSMQSDQEKNDIKYEQEQLASLGDGAYANEFLLSAKQKIASPLRTASTTTGQLAPLIVAAIAAGTLGAPAAIAAPVIGGLAGAGSVKGNIADVIKSASDEALLKDSKYRTLRETMNVDDAKKEFAIRASSYSEAKIEILTSAVIGALSGSLGSVDKGLIAAIGKNAIAKQTVKESFKKAALKEVATEIPQEMSETALANIASNKGGADIKTMQGVAAAGGAAAVSAVFGAGILKAAQSSSKKADAAPVSALAPVQEAPKTTAEAFKRASLIDALKSGDINAIEDATVAAEGAGINVAQIEAEIRENAAVMEEAM